MTKNRPADPTLSYEHAMAVFEILENRDRAERQAHRDEMDRFLRNALLFMALVPLALLAVAVLVLG